MPQNDDSLRCYRLKTALPAGVFGETYAITAMDGVDQYSGRVEAEWCVFTLRPAQRMLHGILEMPFGKVLSGICEIGVNEVHQEALNQAGIALSDYLAERSEQLQRPDIEFAFIEFDRIQNYPLVGAWMRGLWKEDVRNLITSAQTIALRSHCAAVSQIRMVITSHRG